MSISFGHGRLPGFQGGSADFGTQNIVWDANYIGDALDIVPEQLPKVGAHIAYLRNRAAASRAR